MSSYSSTPDSTAVCADSITPSDATNLPKVYKAVYIGGSGNISAILEYDTTAVTFNNVQAGSVLPIRVKKINATGTTATGLVGLV